MARIGSTAAGDWSVPATEVPSDRAAFHGRLFDDWERVDRWTVDHQREAHGT